VRGFGLRVSIFCAIPSPFEVDSQDLIFTWPPSQTTPTFGGIYQAQWCKIKAGGNNVLRWWHRPATTAFSRFVPTSNLNYFCIIPPPSIVWSYLIM
jgi:hypothetical protein